jgi:hypothetical protein
VWLNIVDDEQRPRVRRMTERLAECGWVPRTLVEGFGVDEEGEYGTDNYLIGTAAVDRHLLDAFLPFPGLAHPRVELARRSFRAMASRVRAL